MNISKLFLYIVCVTVLAAGFVSVLPEIASASTIGNWYKDPAAIRDFVNSKGYNIPTAYNGQGAMNYDDATALKICQLAGFNAVSSKACAHSDGRCGYTTCSDNVMAKWNSSTNNFDLLNACSAGNKWIGSLVCKNNCTSHTTKQCVGNSVYWYDSCGAKEDLFQNCSTNQTCQNGQCQNITCSSASDCGTSGYTGDPFCKNGDVYRARKTYTCSNPGTVNSQCSNSTGNILIQNCGDNQTCNNGACQNINITCSSASDCGTNGYIGDLLCQGNDVYRFYKTYTCSNPGTANSECFNSMVSKLITDCSSGQTCNNGVCQNVNCSSASDCGNNGYIGDAFCQNGDVYKSYKTYTCSNPGTANSQCSNSTQNKLLTNCSSNQTCSNGSCENLVVACSNNSQCGTNGFTGSPFCQSGDVYQNYKTYTCSNPGTANSVCSNSTSAQLKDNCASNQTCSNGSCENLVVACSANSQCGTNGYVDSPFCQSGDVYQNYKTYVCNNGGTSSSYCSNTVAGQLKTNCTANQTCGDGTCIDQNSLIVSCYATPNPSKTDQSVSFIASAIGGTGIYTYTWSGACTGSSQICSQLFSQTGTYNTVLNVVSGGQSAGAICSAVVNQNCSSHYSKRCLGNDSYWYDSCGNQEGIFQDCTSANKVCNNGVCEDVNVACSNNSACGTNGYTGSPFCMGNSTYQNYKTYTCSNPGTANSACSESTTAKLKTNCTSNQTCSLGVCENINIACSTNSACGTNGYTGSAFCQNGDVYQNYKTYTCSNPGTANSVCSDSTAPQLKTNCSSNQTCSNGSCQNVNIACSTNSACGTNGYTGSPFCQNGNVNQNYKTYTCNNPGTANSYCSESTSAQLKDTCTSDETCTNGFCTNATITCVTNSQCGTNGYTGNPYCQGSDVYQNYKTYTCNNPGTANSACSDSTAPQLKTDCASGQTCSDGACQNVTIACSTNSACGTNGYTGDSYCQGGDVYQNYKTYTCSNPGTANSVCSDSTAPQLKTNCTSDQTCSNGSCSNVNIACSNNSACGSNGYTGSPFCQGNNVYQNYRTYTCNNAGTANSYCSESTSAQQKENCYGSQTCSNGSCSNVNIACSNNSACGTNGYTGSPFCQGNNVYQNYRTYTCNNSGTSNSYCSESTYAQLKETCYTNQGCSNGYCSTQQNYFTVQTNSATNTYNNQATLNGYVSGTNTNNMNYVWFQWGTTTSYSYNGYETNHQTANYTGSFSQNISGLTPGVVYYFRAVGQNSNGQIVYGQDMTFQSGQVLGVTDVSTGLTNNFLVDSFFLPLMIALAGVWLFKSGIFGFDGWVDSRRIKHIDYIANKKLQTRIVEIKARENLN